MVDVAKTMAAKATQYSRGHIRAHLERKITYHTSIEETIVFFSTTKKFFERRAFMHSEMPRVRFHATGKLPPLEHTYCKG